VLIAPLADHLSSGTHLRASALAVAALARAQLQCAVRLDVPAPVREGAKLLLLAGAEALPEALAPGLRRHVESGGDLLLLGRCERVDDEGRALGPLFPEAKPGLERLGDGRILWLVPAADAADPYDAAPLEAALQKSLRELLGRTPRTLSISGRANLWTAATLTPSGSSTCTSSTSTCATQGSPPRRACSCRSRARRPAGAGSATGSPTTAAEETASGSRSTQRFSVSTVLPAVGASALLSVPR